MARGRMRRLRGRQDLTPAAGELMGECWHRPDELLVVRDDLALVEPELTRWQVRPLDPTVGERPAAGRPAVVDEVGLSETAERLGLVRLETPARMSVTALVTRLRQVADGPEPRIGPNHVLMGEQSYGGGPADDPEPADPPERVAPPDAAGRDVTVGVLDTGLVSRPRPTGRFVLDASRDSEVLDADDDGRLDDQAGHGTFVAGVVLRHAPAATVHVARVLDSWGVGDELTVAAGMLRLDGVDVMNLSLGGYTHGNVPPLALTGALEALDERTVVVAAAGNYGRSRPMWPAALKGVVAVGALDHRDGQRHRAAFSNHGWWVDACAPGVKVHSNFVVHRGPGTGDPDPDDFAGWARWSGTSFATPRVAGRIAARMTGPGTAWQTVLELLHQPGAPRLPGLGAIVE